MIFSPTDVIDMLKGLQRCTAELESDGACGDPDCCGEPAYSVWIYPATNGDLVKWDDVQTLIQKLVDFKAGR
jgi:hypothetical protein